MERIKQILESLEQYHSEDTHVNSEKGGYPPDGINSRIHDGALVCSGARHITGDLERVRERLERETGLLDKWVEEQGGITGHIKAIISVNGPVYRLSSTGGEVDCKELGIKNIHVSIVAIVFEIEQKKMEQRVESLLEDLI